MAKSAYFDKRRERNKQKLEVLLLRKDFQADITELRKLLKIPEGGFTDENAYTMWEINLELETQKYFSENSPSMIQRLQELKEKGQMAEYEQERLMFNQKAPRNFINYCIWQLIHKYKLSTQWRSSLKNYVIFNDIENFWVPASNISMNIKWDKKTGHRELSLIIYANTTLEDVKAIWPQVMKQQEQLQDKDKDKSQPIPNLKLDKRVFELWKSGTRPYEKIAEKIREEFNQSDFIYTDVSNALKRYKKRFG
ncbi:hypothetical protein IPM65_04675 [Candidatus Roizmanbacteria bacterium]|nr:MAG: hypothetical protein IPM65_04675 [Candidatus Roizmanbacteria bacterium]